MLSVFDRLRTSRRASADRQSAEFDQLAHRLACGETIPDREVQTFLDATGHPQADLEALVGTYQERARQATLLDEEAALRVEAAEVAAEINALDAESRAWQERHAERRSAASSKYSSLSHRLTKLRAAKQALEGDCPDTALLARLRVAREQLAAVQSQLAAARERQSDVARGILSSRQALEEIRALQKADPRGERFRPDPAHTASLESSVRAGEIEAADLQKRIAELEPQAATAAKEVADLQTIVYTAGK
jgi:chromosome segregation ATPase